MKESIFQRFYLLLILIACLQVNSFSQAKPIKLFPANAALSVNPDTYLELTFPIKPTIGTSGTIRVYNAQTNELVDKIDMSIPAGPTERVIGTKAPYISSPYNYNQGRHTNKDTKPGTPSAGAEPTPDSFQLTIIGGFTDGFHFYPIIIHGNTATIQLHHNMVEYNHSYYVEVDPEVLQVNGRNFAGISGRNSWHFNTKSVLPTLADSLLTVSADGTGDFNTVQGAMDFIPDHSKKRTTVFIKNGLYEEIVYFRNKDNVTLLGESRDGVIIQYNNREIFNPHPSNISTNEMPGTFPSRRAAFMADNSTGIHLVNFTVRTLAERAQAEGLLINGSENIVYAVNIAGSGDALQTNGSAYYKNCLIEGWGDMILGRGPTFFDSCTLVASGPFQWIRNTDANHGNVFLNCVFKVPDGKEAVLARLPTNGGKDYPYSESVLINCHLSGISAEGWGTIGGPTDNIHYWEFNSRNLQDDSPVDAGKRHPVSKQLILPSDEAIIKNYSTPSFVLGGWKPMMAPYILSQPLLTEENGKSVLQVDAAAIPLVTYQWYKNGVAVKGATRSSLSVNPKLKEQQGLYYVVVSNSKEKLKSSTVTVK